MASDKPRELLRLDVGHGFGGFKDLDSDGVYELEINDWSYAYWKTSFAGSPAPRVILAWDGHQYAPSVRLMKLNSITPEAIAKSAVTSREVIESEDGLSELLRTMLDLIYCGRSEQAYDYFDQAWPDKVAGKSEFRRELLMIMADSPYRDVIEALGHPPLPRRSQLREKSQ